MDDFSIAGLKAAGFVGFERVVSLRRDEVPAVAAVYVVVRPSTAPPEFTATSPGGWPKDKDPTVSVERLRAEWVDGSALMYVGQSDDIGRRLDALRRFGEGQRVGHGGGRLIWQLVDHRDLLAAWRPRVGARNVDKRELLAAFKQAHGGRRPFANLNG